MKLISFLVSVIHQKLTFERKSKIFVGSELGPICAIFALINHLTKFFVTSLLYYVFTSFLTTFQIAKAPWSWGLVFANTNLDEEGRGFEPRR